jgi:ferric-dicitrate binding protein FerR (iron transport regulator)
MNNEEDVTAQLLRLAGAPPDPSADRTARVREAVHQEWSARLRRRRVRRRTGLGLIAAAAAVVVIWIARSPSVAVPPEVTANVVRIQGRPLMAPDTRRTGSLVALAMSDAIHVNDVIETDGESRASLQTSDGTSARIDRASRVRFLSPPVLEVLVGGVYVVSAEGIRGFEVSTPLGSLRDIGTQFEVRVTPSLLRVRVRTGTVEIKKDAGMTTAAAGTEAIVTAGGIDVRRVAAFGADWSWTTEVAPAFVIEGKPLRVFLEHVAAEEGWTLRYDAGVADTAARTILHGSVAELKAEEAIGAVLASSGLDYRVRAGELLISRSTSAR